MTTNLADALMNVLESFFDSKPAQYPDCDSIVLRIRERHKHFAIPPLFDMIEHALSSLLDYKMLQLDKDKEGYFLPGPRWRAMPIDQLEEE